MPTARFDRSLAVRMPRQQVWDVLTDVPHLVSWVDIIEDAREIEPLERYSAVLSDKIGPFKLRADLDIAARDVTVGEQITLSAEGQDRQAGARLLATIVMELQDTGAGLTGVRISGSYDVTGRIASMGSSMITKKAQKILDQFFARAGDALGEA